MIENLNAQKNIIIKVIISELKQYPSKCLIADYNPQIIKSGIEKFDNTKIYLDTSSVEGVNNIGNGEYIEYSRRPSRANMQPAKDSIWFAKMKNSYKNILITQYDDDLLNKYVFSTGFMGVKGTKELPLSLLTAIFLSKGFSDQRDLFSVGTTMAGVNNESFLKIEVPYLNQEQRNLFDEKNKFYVNKLALLRKQTKQLQYIKNLLLNKYF